MKLCMMSIIYIDGYKLVHYRVVVKHTNIKPLVTHTDTDKLKKLLELVE